MPNSTNITIIHDSTEGKLIEKLLDVEGVAGVDPK